MSTADTNLVSDRTAWGKQLFARREGWAVARSYCKIVVAVVAVLTSMPRVTRAATTATFVKSGFTTSSAAGGGAEFDSASATLFVDPAITKWIAWNDAPTVSY